jgi:hypothetical protein
VKAGVHGRLGRIRRRNTCTNPNAVTNTTTSAAVGAGTTITGDTANAATVPLLVPPAKTWKVVTGAVLNAGLQLGSYAATFGGTGTGISLWVLAPNGASMQLDLNERSTADASIGTSSQAFTGTGAWQQLFVARVGSVANTKVRLTVKQLTATAQTFYVSTPTIEVASVMRFPIDGNQPDSEWEGTAELSASRRPK